MIKFLFTKSLFSNIISQKRKNMNIELRFLKKAIEDKNYISFKYEEKAFKGVKPLKIENDILTTDVGKFNFSRVSKFMVLKDRF